MAARAALVSADIRCPWSGRLCPGASSAARRLTAYRQGSEEGWLRLETQELEASVASLFVQQILNQSLYLDFPT